MDHDPFIGRDGVVSRRGGSAGRRACVGGIRNFAAAGVIPGTEKGKSGSFDAVSPAYRELQRGFGVIWSVTYWRTIRRISV